MELFGLSEPAVRLTAFVAIFGTMAVFELYSPRLERAEMMGALKTKRWLANLALVVISSLALRLVFPAAAVGSALWAEANGYGLTPAVGLQGAIAGIAGFVILDFAIWLEHVASHKFPLLWRIHRMHHADNGFDVTTALRFHPLEIVLSMVWKAAVIVTLGVPPLAVLLFEIVLNGSAMFNHSNVNFPRRWDALLRHVIVTPDMHRVHHSAIPAETDSNYGFNFSFWDRIFGVYTAQPSRGHDGIDIGLNQFRGPNTSGLWWMLMLPFRRSDSRNKP
jgi:sterol desaturase/sphingolipid hydroxylase (fatty acid hydroxylase superfamily)